MIDSAKLINHIQQLEPAKAPARLAFFHFLQNLTEASEPLTFEVLNRFFYRALLYPTWQENKLLLFTEVNQLVQHYLDHWNDTFSFENVVRPDQIQVVTVASQSNLRSLVGRFIENNIGKLDQYRIFDERDGRVVAVLLLSDRSVKVMSFQPQAAILTGDLVPLCTDFCVHYLANLSLSPFELHQIDLGQFASSRFRYLPAVHSSPTATSSAHPQTASGSGVRGCFVRGYTLNKFASLDGGPITQYPQLFYPLKRLEQFFVNRKTDPTYIELTTCLERASELINDGHPESLTFGTEALDRAKLAFEQIFPDDKLLRLLINHLEKTLALQAQASQQNQAFQSSAQPSDQLSAHTFSAQSSIRSSAQSSAPPSAQTSPSAGWPQPLGAYGNTPDSAAKISSFQSEPGLPIPSDVSPYGWTPQLPKADFLPSENEESFGVDLTESRNPQISP